MTLPEDGGTSRWSRHHTDSEDGFTDAEGNADDSMPVTISRVTLSQVGDKVRMVIEAQFPSVEAMEELIAMGMEEGIRRAVGQIDALLAEVRH